MDFEFSLLFVLGCAYCKATDFNIGSNLAAGEACLYAAHVETQMMGLQSWHLRQEWERKVLVLRWTDDLWLVLAGVPSAALEALLRRFTHQHSYACFVAQDDVRV